MTGQGIVSDQEAVDILWVPWEELAQFGHLGTEAQGILFKCGFWQDANLVKHQFFLVKTLISTAWNHIFFPMLDGNTIWHIALSS